MNNTFDHKQINRHYGILDVDTAFKAWWKEKLNITLTNKDGHQLRVPVFFFSSERWSKAREDGGIRDKNGTLVLPIIAIIRGGPSVNNDGPFGRSFADTQEEYVFSKRVHPKSSLLKNLKENAMNSLDPTKPIYEMFTAPVPDHYQLTYEVKIWTQYVEEMNEIIEKLGQELNFKSERSFQFNTDDGYYFIAFQDDDFADESNMEEYTDGERLIRMTTTFTVPANILPESNQKKNSFKRYLSQTKLVIKTETSLTDEEFDKLIG